MKEHKRDETGADGKGTSAHQDHAHETDASRRGDEGMKAERPHETPDRQPDQQKHASDAEAPDANSPEGERREGMHEASE